MKTRIEEIELNFSNICGGNCMICAKAHGRGNVPLMQPDVFHRVFDQLHDISFDTIQTSGNGDCFLNPHFMGYLRALRSEWPNAKIHNYNSFQMYTPRVADEIIGDHLVDEQHTRIDSLDPDIFRRSTGLNPDMVFSNLEYFLWNSNAINVTLGYSSIPAYYRHCRKYLGKLPAHGVFGEDEVDEMEDEFEAVRTWGLNKVQHEEYLSVSRINQSLWAEREDPKTPEDPDSPCPKYAAGLLDRICWIHPNGQVGACGYDDSQDTFIIGNIIEEPLASIWNGQRRQEVLQTIAERRWKRYPCSPICCQQRGDKHV